MSESGVDVAERWRPNRAGIRNIWEYDDQEFEFAEGRLVLRGPNGSGKSNALALLVPFLLDGVMAANRMDSLSGGRSMKTLLLSLADDERAGKFRHDQRTGYSWLEFRRGTDHLTIGCGARASTQRDAEAWFFVTPLRVGVDLDLAPGGVPLSKGGLASAVGTAAVHESAEAHRAAVDRALLGLGPHRYRNLMELLLVLRRPHLAGKLNLEHLSKVLSDGLAPLDGQLIAEVAASFDDLEAVQNDLRQLRDAHRTVQAFLPVYRRYLRAAARARALASGEAARRLRSAQQRLVDATTAVTAAEAAVEELEQGRLLVNEKREIGEQRRLIVIGSEAFKGATTLAEVEQRAADAARRHAEAEDRLAAAASTHESAVAAVQHADAALVAAATSADQAFAAAAETADAAGIAWPVPRAELESPDLGATLRGLSFQRGQDIDDVRQALAAWEKADTTATATREAATTAEAAASRLEDERLSAAAALDSARSTLADELHRWVVASGLGELGTIADTAFTLGDAGAPSLAEAVAVALRPRRESLAAADARAVDRSHDLSRRLAELEAERRRVAEEPVPAPDRLPTRPADRSGRLGAPLYACCDFADAVPEVDRAGLEAAIEAAGLLDAWIGDADGTLDAWLSPVQSADSPTLADVLVPTPPSGLSAEAIGKVLASISLSEAGISVLPDGRFRLGPLAGRYGKPEAEFIGATAREQRRQRLLASLDEAIEGVAAELDAVAHERTRIGGEQARLDAITGSVPPADDVLGARDRLLGAVAAARTSREAADSATDVARAARAAAGDAAERLRATAADRRLPNIAADLDRVANLVKAFTERANELVSLAGRLADVRTARATAASAADRATRDLEARTGERDDQRRDAAGLNARVEQLRVELGPEADAPVRELASIEEDLTQLRSESDRLHGDAQVAAERRGAAHSEKCAAADAIAEHAASVAAAAARLDVLRRSDVWSVISPAPVPADAAGLAAATNTATADISAPPDINALERAYRQLLDELGRGYNPSLAYVDNLAVVEVTSDDGTFSVLSLGTLLGDQVARQEELLSERDREIFERHLLTRVSEALRDLLNDADDLVAHINRSLAARPTASGKTVQLRWELESTDAAVKTALGLLRKTPDLLGPEERERLRRFFSTSITQRRAEDTASSYAEILRQVLDYRSWHGFVPQVRSAGGGVQRLTKTLFRSLSGGEQAVVLHMPLFAAAAAHYDTAEASAPRLIALDEAFAGIDEGMRAELMGLLVRFDLDIVLTGHELWGAYEQVPSLMVYDLLRRPPLEGVSAFAVRWDGDAMAEV